MYTENDKGPRTVPWGTPDKIGAQTHFIPFTTTRFLKQRKEPFQCLATKSTAKQFAFKEFMRCIKCLFKIRYECVNLSSVVQDFSPIIYYRSQLSFTTVSFPECMLPVWQEFIFIKISHDIWTYYVFEYLARYTNQGNWVIIARKWPVTLLEKGADICKRPFLWDFTLVSTDCWKTWANTGPNSVASSFRTLGWSSSGPKALEGFKPLRSLITPTYPEAGPGCVNWPLNASAFSRSDWATLFPFFLFRGGIPWVSFFWLLIYW